MAREPIGVKLPLQGRWVRIGSGVALLVAVLAIFVTTRARYNHSVSVRRPASTATNRERPVASGASGSAKLPVSSRRSDGATPDAGDLVPAPMPSVVTSSGFVLPTKVSEVGGAPMIITEGPDHNMWFTESGANKIGRITTGGSISEFALPSPAVVMGIASGPDGNLWFTEGRGNKIGRITTFGAITEFSVPTPHSKPNLITSGRDGRMWFTEEDGNKIGYISMLGSITEFEVPTQQSAPQGIVSGLDGNLWFTELVGNRIGRITPTGAILEFAIPTPGSRPLGIAAGPDGALWFTEGFADKIGRIAASGSIAEFPLPAGGVPYNAVPGRRPGEAGGAANIVTGPDGNLWFTELNANMIGRMAIDGRVTFSMVATPQSGPFGIASGSDGNIWFTELQAGRVERIRP